MEPYGALYFLAVRDVYKAKMYKLLPVWYINHVKKNGHKTDTWDTKQIHGTQSRYMGHKADTWDTKQIHGQKADIWDTKYTKQIYGQIADTGDRKQMSRFKSRLVGIFSFSFMSWTLYVLFVFCLYLLAEESSCSARENLQFEDIWDLLAGQNSCSSELSMKKFFNLGTNIQRTAGKLPWRDLIHRGYLLFCCEYQKYFHRV